VAKGIPVLMDHDGGLEDFTALLLLLSYENVQLKGISVVPADCLPKPATSVTRKILDLANRQDVPVAEGSLDGTNPFPLAWRLSSLKVDQLPVLNQNPVILAPLDPRPGHESLVANLLASTDPVTLLMTGPLTHVAWCLDHNPELEPKIKEIIWMGGALRVDGNVRLEGHDGSAEWNVYWDPQAAKRVFDSKVPITLFALDVTDVVEVTPEFCQALGRQYEFPFSSAAGAIWAMTFGNRETTGLPYYCWDSVTTAYLARPDLFEFEDVRCDIVVKGESEGRTVEVATGRKVKAAMRVNVDGFYQHCIESLRR
jgi:purine nucleosidase